MSDNIYKYMSRQQIYEEILGGNPGSPENQAMIQELNFRAKQSRRNLQKIRRKVSRYRE